MKQFYMAPMEGITTDAYRRAYHKNFTSFDKYFTPFIVPYEKERFAIREKREIDPERNKGMILVPQILTNQADGFLHTVAMLKEYGYKEVNLNLGCPSKTVASKGRGSGFLGFPDELDHFLYDIYDKSDIKISIKTRIGKEAASEFERLLTIYEKYPVSELIIHPRVMTDYYNNIPSYDTYEYAVQNSTKSLVYNGDINSWYDLDSLIRRFPDTDKIMIGRGILRNPFLLDEISVHKECEIHTKENHDRLRSFHYDLVDNYREICKSEKNVLFKIKEVWLYMSQLFDEEKEQIALIRRAQDLNEVNNAVEFILS